MMLNGEMSYKEVQTSFKMKRDKLLMNYYVKKKKKLAKISLQNLVMTKLRESFKIFGVL